MWPNDQDGEGIVQRSVYEVSCIRFTDSYNVLVSLMAQIGGADYMTVPSLPPSIGHAG